MDVERAPPQNKPSNTSQETGVVPRFLVVKKNEGDFAKVSPFTIEKDLYSLIGSAKSINKIREGLLVETVSTAQSKRLLDVKKLGDSPVIVVPHTNLNTSKGVIYCPDLLNCSIEEILEGLKDQHVSAIRRIKVRRDGNLIDSPNHILTFSNPILPKYVKVAFYRLNVRLYIPPPMRCFKCQKFGHTSLKCNDEQVCICGKPLHVGNPCEEPLTCINCEGPHSARSRNCPIYKQETAIQELKTKERISYIEAKKRIAITTPTANVSYAQATKSPKTDYESLIAQLVPKIVAALSPLINQGLPISTTTTSPEKRKRDNTSEHVSLSSGDETSLSSQVTEIRAKPKPKKRGWPRGKPRKNTSD